MKEYSGQAEYMAVVAGAAQARQGHVEDALREAFRAFIQTEQVEVIAFCDMSVVDLASAILAQPIILKALLAACNCAARAIERDIGIRNLDTYEPRLSKENAMAIAGYLKPFLPGRMAIPSLGQLDRVNYMDKEVRLRKGRGRKW